MNTLRWVLLVGTEVTVSGFGGRAVLERAIVTSFRGSDGKEFFVMDVVFDFGGRDCFGVVSDGVPSI